MDEEHLALWKDAYKGIHAKRCPFVAVRRAIGFKSDIIFERILNVYIFQGVEISETDYVAMTTRVVWLIK